MKELERWKEEMPKEEEMGARDKYWFFDRKVRGYRKGVHSKFFLSVLVVAHRFIAMRWRWMKRESEKKGARIDLARYLCGKMGKAKASLMRD